MQVLFIAGNITYRDKDIARSPLLYDVISNMVTISCFQMIWKEEKKESIIDEDYYTFEVDDHSNI